MDEKQGVRRWSDQPAILEEGTHVCGCKVRKEMVQVVSVNGVYYVTVGSLFGSETVECGTADAAFKCIDILSHEAGRMDPEKHGFNLVENDNNKG